MKQIRPRLKGNIRKAYESLINKESKILVIGDLHEPFCLDGSVKHLVVEFPRDGFVRWLMY